MLGLFPPGDDAFLTSRSTSASISRGILEDIEDKNAMEAEHILCNDCLNVSFSINVMLSRTLDKASRVVKCADDEGWWWCLFVFVCSSC